MSLENRSNSATFKRAEQLKRWEESATNLQEVEPKLANRKIKFSLGCVFLAACAAGDKEEVLRLLDNGADIDTANVDGLTALHQENPLKWLIVHDKEDFVEWVKGRKEGYRVKQGGKTMTKKKRASTFWSFGATRIFGSEIKQQSVSSDGMHLSRFHRDLSVAFLPPGDLLGDHKISKENEKYMGRKFGSRSIACIDNNLDMVEFLVNHGADVNRGDNEGWTPLHATASCGFISIAKYLIESGASVAAVNNDGELPLDIAESDAMDDILQEIIDAQGIDCDVARNGEEIMMLEDAKNWLNGDESVDPLAPHPKSGATALHVAAAKGYIKVMSILLQGQIDIDIQDFDGWTPLHAAAHWGQKEAAEMLVENFCNMDIKNYVGQSPMDVADITMVTVLEDLRTKQAALQKDRPPPNNMSNKALNSPKRRSSITRMSVNDKTNLINKDVSSERQLLDRTISEEPSNKVKKVEIDLEEKSEKEEVTSSSEESNMGKNGVNLDEPIRIPSLPDLNKTALSTQSSVKEESPAWRRPGSFRNKTTNEQPKNLALNLDNKVTPNKSSIFSNEVVLRRTHSFEADEKYLELQARIASSCPALHPPTGQSLVRLPTRSASLRERQATRQGTKEEPSNNLETSTPVTTPTIKSTGTSQITTTSKTVSSPTLISQTSIGRSFVPPVRDEESETQRKAHAKRVRETRRSTQGVTLEEIKSAEQLVKKRNQQATNNNDQPVSSTVSTVSATATITAAPTATSVPSKDEEISHERRPSWRLKVDNNNKFLLEDARTKTSSTTDNTSYIRRHASGGVNALTAANSLSTDNTGEATITVPLRRPSKPEDKEDKENDSRNALATQAVIQRRRKPKRRSTGVVHLDMDELDPEKQDSGGAGDSEVNKLNKEGEEHIGPIRSKNGVS
ncbi:hypothetical protein RUM43_002769 [Polyplax serrata]|uniref:Protein phosphatase 1 regulatory subunit 12A n=1 Tax=Polyplax serrata TaxID=468196 RepID=A0AAN8PEF3_POLSC